MFLFAICLFLYVSALVFYTTYWKRRHLPAGPTPLPILGNLYELIYKHKHPWFIGPWLAWAKQYGPAYTIWFGHLPMVIVTDSKLIRDLFVREGETFSGRYFFDPVMNAMQASGGLYGVSRTNGKTWQVLRRYEMEQLRKLGMGKPKIEGKCLEIMSRVCNRILRDSEMGVTCFDTTALVNSYNSAIINFMVFGNDNLDENVPEEYAHFRDMTNKVVDSFVWLIPNLLSVSPWLRHFPPFKRVYREMEIAFQGVRDFYDDQIYKRVKERRLQKDTSVVETDDSDEQRELCFLDAFLDQMELQTERIDDVLTENDSTPFSLNHLRIMLMDTHFATETNVASTLQWIILFLMWDNRVQLKLQAELDQIAASRSATSATNEEEFFFTNDDRINLPYANAIIEESLRCSVVIPFVFPRRVIRDTKIGDQTIQKDTIVVYETSAVFADEKLFPNHQEFIPERFIDQNGQFKKSQHVIAFGVGKRVCPGESLARMELFLFLTNFFYKFKATPKDPLAEAPQRIPSLVSRPAKFEARLERRIPSPISQIL